MHASFAFLQSILQLAYTTQAWIKNLKTYAMQANICNAHTNASNKFMSLLPPTCVLQILIDPLPLPFHFVCSPYLTIFVNYFSPFGIKYHKRWAQILDRLGWNHVIWGSFSKNWFNLDHLQKIFNSVWFKGKLLHTSFQGLSWPCWVKYL